MKRKVVAYWVVTGLFVVGFGIGAVLDLLAVPQAQEIMKHLGYPDYMARMLGVFKVVGLAVILAPGLPRAKEWAYAGVAIDLLGATTSHISAGYPQEIAAPILFLVVGAASWALRPQSRVMGQLFAGQGSQAAASGVAVT